MSDLLKLRDSDTGESKLDVVRVPEGFSFQMAYVTEPGGYVSVIVSPEDALNLADFLRGLDP